MPETDGTDEALVVLCLQGDVSAFAGLVRRYQQVMYRTAFHMVGDADEAADIVQAGFVKAWEKLDTFNPDYRFFSWLYRIVVNETLNRRRAVRPLALVPADDAHYESPHEEMERAETSARLKTAIDALPDTQKVVVLLRYFDGMSYRDMAEVLQIDEGTVKSRLYAGRLKLREMLA